MNTTVVPASIIALAAREAELRALVIGWSEQNSGSGNIAGLDAMLGLLRTTFSSLPGEIADLPLAGTPARALRVRVRPEARVQLCLSGHYDTVYAPEHPFQHCVACGETRLVGPGTADMKGGLVVMLAALQAFEQTTAATQVGYEILLGPDEEIGSPGSAPLLAAAAAGSQLGLVFEPARADGSLVRTRMGTGRLDVRCRGRAAHAAKPKDGRNAIAALAEFLVAAHRVPEQLPGVMLNVGHIRGGGAAVNIVPDCAKAALDMRIASPSVATALLAKLEALADPIQTASGCRLELKANFKRPPKETGPPEAAAFAAMRVAARDLGMADLTWVDVGGGSDGNLLRAAGLPNLDGLGPVGGHYHSAREYVELPSLVTRAQLVALFLHRVATGEAALVP